jgi:predicted amidohydrolase
VISELPDNEESIQTHEIDLAMVRKRRREVPLVREARLGLLAREATRLAEEGGDA